MFVNTKKRNWDEYIDSVLFAYRTSVHASTGFTPFELVFGRQAHMPPGLLYELESDMVAKELGKDIHVSDSMNLAYKLVRKNQAKIFAANKARRDKPRKDISFAVGEMVMKFDKTVDKAEQKARGTSKFQYRFSHPLRVMKRDPRNDNLYFVVCPVTGKEDHVNVNKLVPVLVDIGDLGQPLGARSMPTEESTKPYVQAPIKEGDMVALLVAPDQPTLPFSVGKVTKIGINGEIVLQWYGTYAKNIMTCVWRKGFYQATTDNKIYYANTKSHTKHKPFTSECLLNKLTIDEHVLGSFHLTDEGRVPLSFLKRISESDRIEWQLPEPMRNSTHN
jgi:hypothetical protein